MVIVIQIDSWGTDVRKQSLCKIAKDNYPFTFDLDQQSENSSVVKLPF